MSKLVFRVKNVPDSLPSVNITDELDVVKFYHSAKPQEVPGPRRTAL